MLVCSDCGTKIQVAGHPCPACGGRGVIDARFFRGEIKEPPAPGEGAAPPVVEASASGAVPDEQRAWSPWLAAVLALFLGPAAGSFVAARNLRRLRPGGRDPWTLAGGVLAGQCLVAVIAGVVAKSDYRTALWPMLIYVVVLAVLLVRWQAPVVAQQRRQVPGRHSPGVDAFGAFLVALVLFVVSGWLTYRLADRFAEGVFSKELADLRESLKPEEPPMLPMGMPPM